MQRNVRKYCMELWSIKPYWAAQFAALVIPSDQQVEPPYILTGQQANAFRMEIFNIHHILRVIRIGVLDGRHLWQAEK